MASTPILEQMLTTIIDGQKEIVKTQNNQAQDIADIRATMTEIVKLEAQQVSQKEALSRIGKHVDKIEALGKENYRETHNRINAMELHVTDLRIISARLVVKVSLIVGGVAGVIGTAFAFVLPKIF